MSGFDAFRSERDQLPTTLVGTPRAAMITVDEAGTVTGWSPGAHLLLGYLAGQVVGQPVARILASGDRVLSAVRDGWSGELTVRHADHRLLTLPAQAYALSHRSDRQWLLMVTEPEESFASQNGQAMLD